ncbi:MAG TPA: enoyl-CoA hydratase [Acidimicrobiales bacterium]|nr:enoyl-CoA hydratase [Acidimicrobiales bacterium]
MAFVTIDTPRPHVRLVTLDRPERMNAMAFDVMIPLREAIDAIGRDGDARVLVLTGAGHGFCSGADLEDPGVMPDIDHLGMPSIALRAGRLLHDVIVSIHELAIPVISAINGPAIGGGFCLAAATDIRIAATSAYFRAAGINNGLTAAELGLSFTLPRAIGSSRAMELMLTGRDMDAAEAMAIGFVSDVVDGDDLLDRCHDTADRIVGMSRAGIELTKQMVWAGMESGSFTTHMNAEMNAQLFIRMTTTNFEEAIRARRDGRPPVFTDGM